jgi:magnesium transporter
MARFILNRLKSKGHAPGSLIFIGDQKMEVPVITAMKYNKDFCEEQELLSIDDVSSYSDTRAVTWINIYGIHDAGVVKRFGELFDIHPITLEDVVNTDQRPKLDDNHLNFTIILKMLTYDEKLRRVAAEQVSLVVGSTYVVALQERKGDVFESVRDRIRNQKGRIRTSGADYLMYALMDTIVDNYLSIVEKIGDQVEELGSNILLSHNPSITKEIFQLKIELNYLRKMIRPMREVMIHMNKLETTMIQKKTIKFLKDLDDLITQVTESIETYTSLIADHLNIYNAEVGNRMNEIMRVLTVFAALFIPLTFLAGIYGMNFEHIPELRFKYSYPIFWLVVLIISSSLFYFFKRRKWF